MMLLWKTLLSSLLLVPKALCSDIIHAIEPSCTTNAAGSSSCNVGVNPVPTPEDNPIDGSYQWISTQEIVNTISGTRTTKYIPTFTATETNFLAKHPITTTDESGAAIVTTTTEYVSFISSTASPNGGGGIGGAVAGAAAGAVIIGVLIAPALVEDLQVIAETAVGKTVGDVGAEIKELFGKKKASLTPGDLQVLSKYVVNAARVGAAAVVVSAIWMGNALSADVTMSTNTKSNMTITTKRPEITAIMKFPYDNWEELYLAPPSIGRQLELPSPYICKHGKISTDLFHAKALAKDFCARNQVDAGKSVNESIPSSDDKSPTRFLDISILFDFDFEGGKCELKCVDAYSSLIKTCQYDSHNLNGNSSYEDICGTYSMSVQSTIRSRPLFTQDCVSHTDGYIPFTRDQGIDAINRGCGTSSFAGSITKHFTIFEGSVNITGTMALSRDQDGCNPVSTKLISFEDCKRAFMTAMDNCDTDTRSAKYGAKVLNWSSPTGCIDVEFFGRKRH